MKMLSDAEKQHMLEMISFNRKFDRISRGVSKKDGFQPTAYSEAWKKVWTDLYRWLCINWKKKKRSFFQKISAAHKAYKKILIYIRIYNFVLKYSSEKFNHKPLDVKYLGGYLFTLLFTILFAFVRNGQPIIEEYTLEPIINGGIIVAVIQTIYGVILLSLRLSNKLEMYEKLIKPLR